MNNFDLGRMISRFVNYNALVNRQITQVPQPQTETFAPNIQPTPVVAQTTTANLQMNTLQSMDMAVYAKEVMQLPKNLNEFIFNLPCLKI